MIRVIAICVFRDGDRILVSEGIDSATQECFARPLGGGVERGERSADTIVREIREEIGLEVTELRLLGVMENLFEYQGRPGHEIVFVYDARFADPAVYAQAELTVCEAGWSTTVRWRPLSSFGPDWRLVPEGLDVLLHGSAGSSSSPRASES